MRLNPEIFAARLIHGKRPASDSHVDKQCRKSFFHPHDSGIPMLAVLWKENPIKRGLPVLGTTANLLAIEQRVKGSLRVSQQLMTRNASGA